MVNLGGLKERVKGKVEESRDLLEGIARYLYENPELGSEEYKAYERLTNELEEKGFRVEKELLGMPTDFAAYFKGKKTWTEGGCPR